MAFEKWSRRDFLHLTPLLLAPACERLSQDRPSHESGHSRESGNPQTSIPGQDLGQDRERGHWLREEFSASDWQDPETEHVDVDVVIVGGGVAGLTAAWELKRRGITDVVLLELEDEVGGTSRSGEMRRLRFPWGAHYLPMPPPHQVELLELLTEMNAVTRNADGSHTPREELLIRESEERLFFRGYWHDGLFPYAGASSEDRAQLARFEAELESLAQTGEFRSPLLSSGFQKLELDRISASDWLSERGFTSERLLWFCEYATRDDYGLLLSQTSAWAFLFYWVSRMHESTGSLDGAPLLAWPEGNAALCKHLRRSARQIRERTVAMRIEESKTTEGLDVLCRSAPRPLRFHGRGDTYSRLTAKHVILAVPRFVAARIAPSAQLTTEGYDYGSWVVANVHLRERPGATAQSAMSRGAPASWDNVIYGAPSVGYVSATHQLGRDYGPEVLTWYLPLCGDANEERRAIRRRLEETDAASYRRQCQDELEAVHPGITEHIEWLDVWKWGHAMVAPRVGFLRGGERSQDTQPQGRLHFAHTDLSGVALFEEAFSHGIRAAKEAHADLRAGSV